MKKQPIKTSLYCFLIVLVIPVGMYLYQDSQSRAEVENSIATIGRNGECVIDWSKAFGDNPSNISDELEEKLCILSEQTGTKIIPNSGYRAAEEQVAIGDKLIADNSGYYRDSDGTVRNAEGRLVAETPENSSHVLGSAVDLNRNGISGEFYTEEELKLAGLTASGFETQVRGEPWHIVVDTEKGDPPLSLSR